MRTPQYQSRIIALIGEEHLTADQLYMQLKQDHPSISQATVYRNLEQLVEKGELSKLDNVFGKAYYEKNKGQHAHIICNSGEKIYDVHINDRSFLDIPSNYELDEIDIKIKGRFTSRSGEKVDVASDDVCELRGVFNEGKEK